MLEIMRLTPQICCASKIIGENVRKKFTKADVIKRLMKEHKATFGSLLETKREKNRRLKLEKKGVLIPDHSKSSSNSELTWMLKVSDSRLQLVKIDPNNKPAVAHESSRKISSICANDDGKLSQVQTRIIRKTSGTKSRLSKIEVSEPGVATNSELNPSPKETSSLVAEQNLKEIDIKYEEKRNSSTLQPQENIRENMNKLQLNEKSKVQKAVKSMILNPSESSASSEQNINEKDIQNQEEESNSSIFVLHKSQLDEKSTVQNTVKSKILNTSESSVRSEQNIDEIDIQNQEEESNSSILVPHKNIQKSQLDEKSTVQKAVKSIILNPSESSVSSEQNINEIDIQNQEEESNSSILVPHKNIQKSQLDEKSTVQKAVKSMNLNPSEFSVSSEQNINEIDIQNQEEETNSSILLSCNKIIENINEARLYYEDDENHDVQQSSEILSISPMQKEYFALPSVTKILNATMSDNAKKMLELWMARMIQQLGKEGFDEYKKGLLQNGKLLHSVIDNTLRKTPVEVPDNLKPCYSSVKTVLDEVENVRAIESQVVHQNLGYRGVVDCVASYRGNMCLIDWKKSDKTKHLLSSTYDAPLQIASYIGALNADKNYPFQIKSGLLVIAYTIGEPPTVFTLDQTKLQYYWKQWLGRLKKYYNMQNT